ncbi:MAG: hypothetical protein JXR94_00020 [Candidatus Hydrogenedentes bacterium]|nr:hypothetical protein [Candidatus Hydrogenedentota bacterium]
MSYSSVLLFVSALLAVMAYGASAYAAELAPDGMLEVDGRRMFVLGLYENPADDAVLERVAAAGFNLVHATEDHGALDRLHERGLFAWVNTGYRIDLSPAHREERRGQLAELAGRFASHPALLVWEVPDEALWNVWYGAQTWGLGRGPEQQRKLIGELEDEALAEKLRGMMKEAHDHFERAEFKAWEEVSGAVWAALGQENPNPGLTISDAPERASQLAAGMLEGYGALKELDPAHPIWMNHAPRNSIEQLGEFNRAADIVGCDIYPVPVGGTGHSDLRERSLAAVGAYTVRMQDAARPADGGPGKPAWMVLQGFGWSDLRENPTEEDREKSPRPTFDQSRFMAYDAIARGARGILYWGTAYIEKDSTLWEDLLRLVRELADIEHVLSAPDADMPITVDVAESWGSRDREVVVLAKDVATGPEADRGLWLLVVNEGTEPLRFTIKGLGAAEGLVLEDGRAERRAEVKGGSLDLAIRSGGIQVLRPVR